ncbi:hypothetical protein M408DRAFT_160740 [Serendipita vermifera MAFF 305830]|uniref:Uncharacterized protein n=1 Tax=Serendipita vermifera MAFF 305830 TaxID=933852 RepID=A0A0C2WNT4_SERVB|nr:hypothetical protein M408DRAFT_160740 [Serendipita vermifera MAFF 305830]
MSQKSPSPARRYLVHRQGTVDSLITQGHNALEVAPHASEYASPYVNDWRLLLDRLEVLTLNTPPANSTKSADESGFPLEPVEDSVPKRILKETVSYLRTKDAIAPASRDVELAKYKSLVSQVDKYCRKSMLSTVTTSSSPPTIASDKGSTSSLSVPYDQDLPSPSPLKFTFTRTSTNSFAVDVCPEEGGPEAAAGPPPPGTIPTPSTATQTPTLARLDATQATLARRTRSDTVPNTNSSANSANPNPKTLKSRSRSGSMRDAAAGAIPYTSLQGIAIDENAVHDGREPPPSKIKIPLNLTKPIIGKPSKHRHSRSLPALRQEAVAGPAATAAAAIKTPLPPIPQRPAVHDTDKLIRHTKSTNGE